MDIEREFEYKPSWLIIILGGLLFGVGVGVLAIKANYNNRGLIINHIIELTTSEATIFYWTLSFFSLCFVLMTVGLIFHRFKYRQRIAFTEKGIIVPKSRWSGEEKIIEYKDISGISRANISGQKFIYLIHSGGKFIINCNMLPSKKAVEEIISLLTERINAEKKA
jgi:hypothetical protein